MHLHALKVSKLMTCDPKTLKSNQTIGEAVPIFAQYKTNCAPILDDNGQVVGILTVYGLVEALMNGATFEAKISEVMEKQLQTVRDDCLYKEISALPIERLLVLDKKGRLVGILSRLDLVKKIHDALEMKENELEVMVKALHNGIIAVDAKGIITIYNPAAERIVGVSAHDALGRKLTDIIPNTGLLNVLQTQKAEFGVKQKIGNITVITNRTPIFRDGELVGAVAVFQDVSELESVHAELRAVKELNAELEGIIESSFDGIMVSDGSGMPLRTNSGYQRIMGLSLPDLVSWASGQGVTPETEEQLIIKRVTRAVLERRKPVTVMHTLKTGRNICLTGNPVLDETGNIVRVVSNVRDITELNALQEEIRKTKDLSERISIELRDLRAKQLLAGEIVGNSLAINRVLELALRVAAVDSTVLILGESGVGKELVAKLIHKASQRKEGPFIQINCGAIPENLLESELFGYEKGAFTGASKGGKRGLLEVANGGTLLLDEIAEMPLSLQVKLLRVLQERKMFRLGSVKPLQLDVRIIAATNKDLEELVAKRQFREDLYYRLNVVPIKIPPLRERREDIVPLINHFLKKYNDKYNMKKRISPEAYTHLVEYHWPGNVRELENLVERLVVTSEHDSIRQLPPHIYNGRVDTAPLTVNELIPLKMAKEMVERELIRKALERYKSTREAAKALGVDHTTVFKKAARYKDQYRPLKNGD